MRTAKHFGSMLSLLIIFIVLFFVFSSQPIQSEGPTVYSEVSGIVGVANTHTLGAICDHPTPMGGRPPIGSGSGWGDYDNDGDPDLFVTNHGGADWLYRNDGDSNSDGLPEFTDVAVTAGVDDPTATSFSSVFIDYDNDGDQDVYVTKFNGNTLYQNQLMETGTADFVDVTATAGVADAGRAITSAWGDYDGDGHLDVYLAKHRECPPPDENPQDTLYRNNGDGTFSDVTGILCPGGVAPCAQTSGLGFTAGWVDYDNDGDSDLYLINDNINEDYYANVLWRNEGDGTFTDVSTASNTDISLNGMGLGVGDYDNDGWMDLAFSNIAPGVLLHNQGDGTFADVSVSSGVDATLDVGTWATAFWDYDNNGLLDLYFAGGNVGNADPVPDRFMTNNGDGTFSDFSVASGLDDPGRGRSASMVDFDQDGFVDLFIGNYGQFPGLYHNDSVDQGNTNNWLTITVEGVVSNRDAIGTRIYLTTPDGVTQMRDISSGPTHGGGDFRAAYFGLGTNTTATLDIRWPTGDLVNLGVVNANQALHYIENNGNDIVIDADFTDWDDGTGNEACIVDEGGMDDFAGLDRFEMNQYCFTSDFTNTIQVMMAFDRSSGEGFTTGCAMLDTDSTANGFFDYALCVTLDGSATFAELGPLEVDNVSLFSCNDSLSFSGCINPVLEKSYTSASYGFDNEVEGPFTNNDAMIEVEIPFSDIITGCGDIQTTLFSFPDKDSLDDLKDSIFGSTWQAPNRRVTYDLCDGTWDTVSLPFPDGWVSFLPIIFND